MKKKIITKAGNVIAAIALVVATVGANSTCWHYIYEEPLPAEVKKLKHNA